MQRAQRRGRCRAAHCRQHSPKSNVRMPASSPLQSAPADRSGEPRRAVPGESSRALMTKGRWVEVGRIVGVGLVVVLYRLGVASLPVLLIAVACGLYPLVRTGLHDLIREHKIGTEVFVTIATVIAMLGREYIAGAVLMTIILIAEFIAELNTDRARASIKALIGSVPDRVTVRRDGGEVTLSLAEVRPGDIVLVRAGEKIPVDGVVKAGEGSVNQAPITGESMPQEKQPGATVFAGTVVELGALDVETQKVGGDTMFSRIVALVETAEDSQAPSSTTVPAKTVAPGCFSCGMLSPVIGA